ncbi:Collagen alpha-5(VI) chain [Labeo rohita]|uniref:Collagen alpha-5(VI) chain n=1 Tax=Labeo rohita TaxID=84645 RepID=A0ABQ8L1T7_LABRO|nr:Collagen alpha-5(VI) chain [Labeo rohita]
MDETLHHSTCPCSLIWARCCCGLFIISEFRASESILKKTKRNLQRSPIRGVRSGVLRNGHYVGTGRCHTQLSVLDWGELLLPCGPPRHHRTELEGRDPPLSGECPAPIQNCLLRHGFPDCLLLHHGSLSSLIRNGFPDCLLSHGCLNRLLRHGSPSSLIRHGFPNCLLHHGSPSSRLRHGSLSSLICPGDLPPRRAFREGGSESWQQHSELQLSNGLLGKAKGATSRCRTKQKQKQRSVGGGSGGGRTPRRRTTNKVQHGSNRGRSHGGDKRDPEKEEPGETQAAAMMGVHRGADGGRSHDRGRADDSRGPADSGGPGGGGPRGEDREPMILGDTEDPEGQDGTQGSGDRGGGGDERSSSHDADGDWLTRGKPTAQMVG